jgi:DNA-binding transcriptional regulator GbsR (MarR family)
MKDYRMLIKRSVFAIVLIIFGWSISFIMIWASLVASNVGAITITANNSNTKVYPSSFSNESNHTRQSATDMTMMKMMERGDIAMGFNQNKITHHFVATPDGGKIMITALNGSDKRTIDEIKNHTLDIQKEFSEGNFTKPFFIHAQEVPGTKVMSEKKDLIKYNIRNLNNGSSLQLTTNDKELIDSITQFMEFQAREHYGH